MGIGFNIDFSAGPRAKKAALYQRQGQTPDLFEKLLDRGLKPEEAQAVAQHYAATGELKVPTMRGKSIGMRDGVEASTPEAISYGKPNKKKTLITMDKATGKERSRTYEVGPNDDVSFETYDSTPKNQPESPQEQAARQVLAEYQRAVGNMVKVKGPDGVERYEPSGVTEELANNARAAARMLNIPFRENQRTTMTEKKPGFGAHVQNSVSKATRGLVPPSKAQSTFEENTTSAAPTIPALDQGESDEEAFQRDLARAKQAIAHKVVNEQEAMRRLRLKYPDRFQ